MKHLKALTIKFIMVTAMLTIVLGLFYGVNFGDILMLSVIVTAAAYLIGDLFILPQFGNTTATIADFGLAFIAIWLFGANIIEEAIPIVTASLLSAAAISIGEWFFHKYMKNQILKEDTATATTNRNMQQEAVGTEFAEETDAQDIKQKNRQEDQS
jgi:hypothetical protein